MKKAIVLLIAVSFVLTACSNVDVYTFKKDRVDQAIDGNEGYVIGEKTGPDEARNPKRTLIGIDIGVASCGITDKDDDYAVPKPASRPVSKASAPAAKKPQTVVVEQKKELAEEDWIK